MARVDTVFSYVRAATHLAKAKVVIIRMVTVRTCDCWDKETSNLWEILVGEKTRRVGEKNEILLEHA